MRFRCPITLPNRLTQLDILLLCNHIVHDIRLSFLYSIVAPARGATMLKKQIIPIVRAFQSALPRGERQQIGGSPDEDRNISIHAPARGATIQLHLTQCCSVFQSTLPRGERQQFSPKSSLFSQQKLSKIFNHNNKLF